MDQPTGTASLSVGVFVSPARSGFQPSLNLRYDSGSGNGPFGLGLQPRGALDHPQDVERASALRRRARQRRLHPVREPRTWSRCSSKASRRPNHSGTLEEEPSYVRAYRPRVESAFARIERWQDRRAAKSTGARSPPTTSRACSDRTPTQPHRRPGGPVARLQLAARPELRRPRQRDQLRLQARGRRRRRGRGASEANRIVTANRYLKRVRYGNDSPTVGARLPERRRMVLRARARLRRARPRQRRPPMKRAPGAAAPDPFSSYRSGFEVRTYRRCRRLSDVPPLRELGEAPRGLVRSTDLEYLPDRQPRRHGRTAARLQLLASVTQTGWVPRGRRRLRRPKRCPRSSSATSALQIDETQHFADERSAQNVTGARRRATLDRPRRRGAARACSPRTTHAWYYKHNISAWNPAGGPRLRSLRAAHGPRGQAGTRGRALALTDLNGDGNLCAVSLRPPDAGLVRVRTPTAGWTPVRELADHGQHRLGKPRPAVRRPRR